MTCPYTLLKPLRKPVIIWVLASSRGESSLCFARKAGNVLKDKTTAELPHQTEEAASKQEEIGHHKKRRGSQIPPSCLPVWPGDWHFIQNEVLPLIRYEQQNRNRKLVVGPGSKWRSSAFCNCRSCDKRIPTSH